MKDLIKTSAKYHKAFEDCGIKKDKEWILANIYHQIKTNSSN